VRKCVNAFFWFWLTQVILDKGKLNRLLLLLHYYLTESHSSAVYLYKL